MVETENTYLKFTDYHSLFSWDVKTYLTKSSVFNPNFPLVLFGEFLKKATIEKIKIEDDITYKILGVRTYGKGVFENRIVKGNSLKMREYYAAKPNHLFWCKVDTKNGAFGVIKEDKADGVASSNMTFAEIDKSKINTDFLQLLFTSKGVMSYLDSFVTGTTNRKYIRPDQLIKEIKIPLPSLKEQEKIVSAFYKKNQHAQALELEADTLKNNLEHYLFEKLGIEKSKMQATKKGLQIINFDIVLEWGLDKLLSKSNNKSAHFKITSILETPNLAIDIFRGKSPKYQEGSNAFMLNQKCNRWNNIDLSYVKTVDENWFKSINKNFFTKEGDIIINSTGEGTIGRASYITKEFEGLLYDSHILLLRLDKEIFNPELFVEVFNSSYGQDQVNDIKSAQATKQTELGVSNLTKISFPVPESLEVQKNIVEYIKRIRIKIAYLRAQSELNRKESEIEFEKQIFG